MLGTITVVFWCCHKRVVIGPKQHLLLYHKLVIHRLTKRNCPEISEMITETDWAALKNLTPATLVDTFTFAYRKGFLQIRYVAAYGQIPNENAYLFSQMFGQLNLCRVLLKTILSVFESSRMSTVDAFLPFNKDFRFLPPHPSDLSSELHLPLQWSQKEDSKSLNCPFETISKPKKALLSKRFTYIRNCCNIRKCCKHNNADKVAGWTVNILAIAIYIAGQNWENLLNWQIPFDVEPRDSDCDYLIFQFRGTGCYKFRLVYWSLSMLLSIGFFLLFIFLWETMFGRLNSALETVKVLSNLIIRNTDSEYIEFDYMDNVLSWLALEDWVKRKGMLMFSSLETPLFSLLVLSMASWGSAMYCIFRGTGSTDSLFSNSALTVWAYLAVLSTCHVVRLLWYGHQFNRESKKQTRGMGLRLCVMCNLSLPLSRCCFVLIISH